MQTRIEIATKVIASLVVCGGGLPNDEQIGQIVEVGIKIADLLLERLSDDQVH